MNILWLGHGSFRIEIGDQVLLVDPWLASNPMLDETQHEAALAGATQILVTHGHFDHASEVVAVSERTQAPVSGIVELAGMLKEQGAVAGQGFNMCGTITLGNVRVAMVPASHSSTLMIKDAPRACGTECGFMIMGEGKTVYISGDTGIMADMAWMGAYYNPEVGILSAGGHYTMDMAQAAWAATTYFGFKTVIPCHYRTFPLLEQSAQALIDGLPGVDVIEPEVMTPIAV